MGNRATAVTPELEAEWMCLDYPNCLQTASQSAGKEAVQHPTCSEFGKLQFDDAMNGQDE